MKIIMNIQPFSLCQKLYVYDDGQCIETKETEMNDINNNIFSLIDKYNIDHVDIAGPKSYTSKIKDEFDMSQITKYTENKITVNII